MGSKGKLKESGMGIRMICGQIIASSGIGHTKQNGYTTRSRKQLR